MDRSSATLLEFISRLTYSVDGLSRKLRLYFSQFLTFHFSKTLSLNRIQDIENRRASSKFRNEEGISAVGRGLSITERCWAIAAIGLLREEAERLDDRVVSRRLSLLVSDLTRILELGDHADAIGIEQQNIKEEIRRYEERPVVRIPAAIWPLTLDFILRCATLLYFSMKGLDKSPLIPLNLLVISAIVIMLVIFYRRRNRKANLRLLELYGGADSFKIEFHTTAAQYTWLAFYLISSTFITYLLAGTDGFGESAHVGLFIPFVLYYSLYLRFFNIGRINENDLVRQLDEKEQRTDTLNVDENDEVIVSLETRLNSSTGRLDAYVLESALFGALTFGGFLQIMASELVSFADLEAYAANIFSTSRAFINLDGAGFENGLALLSNKVSLLCLISVESLVCSIFFVAVIASRLRFSDIADKVRTALDLARAYNEKEEALFHESETSDIRQSRLHSLTTRVNRQLFEASLSLRKISPVMSYMQYFRNAGIMVFVIILISSSLFITSALGWTFLAAVGATYIYFNREAISVNFKAIFLQLRILFLKWSVWLFVGAISPFVIAMVQRNVYLKPGTNELEALGYLFIGLFAPAWLLLASHYDQDFGDIEKKENRTRASRWNFVRNAIAAAIVLFCLGMCMKMLAYGGSYELVTIGVFAVTILMYFAGYYLSKIKWLGVVSGSMLGMASSGLLFKSLHFNGADDMLMLGVIGSFALLIILFVKRKAFHSLYLRVCLVVLILTFTVWTSALRRLELAYAHRTMEVGQFLLLTANLDNNYFLSDEAFAVDKIESTDSYISRYGNTVPFHVVYAELLQFYNDLAQTARYRYQVALAKDTAELERALMALRERDKILALYDYPIGPVNSFVDLELHADVLLLLNRRDEAEASLNAMLPKLQMQGHRDAVIMKLAEIKAM